jgi:DNA helicase-2/ATP-dependent DNA helicase PcrA
MSATPPPNWKSFASAIRDYFETVWKYLPQDAIEWSDANKRFRAPDNCGAEPVEVNQQEHVSAESLRMSTIHDIKGESLDAIMLVSSPTKKGDKGGHFTSWLDPASGYEEYTRFAYVACSRPRHLLVVATPTLTVEQVQRFVALGFSLREIGF